MYEPSIENPEVECFAQCRGDIDFNMLFEPTKVVSKPDMEDPTLECSARFGYDLDFDELIEQVEAVLDPSPEMQLECGEM
jgi:hypothetical protein